MKAQLGWLFMSKLTRDCCAVVPGDVHGDLGIDWRTIELKGELLLVLDGI